MQIIFEPSGNARCIYGESIELAALGSLDIRRGSQVEPTPDGEWISDLSPVRGPMLGPFPHRSEALAAEQEWLSENWLCPARSPAGR
jgi:hypothetical protein